MPDETPTPDAGQTDEAGKDEKDAPDAAAVAVAENPDAVKNAIARHQTAAKEAAKRAEAAEAKVREFEERDQSETEKITGQRDKFKSDAEEARVQNLRLRVALEKKLPSDLIDRLQGATQEELEADADKLLELVKPAEATDFDGGARTQGEAEVSPGLGRLSHAYAQKK